MTNRYEELRDLLVKVNDMRWNESLTSDDLDLIAKIIKEEFKKARQNGPAIGQKYWYALISHANSYAYNSDGFDLDICEYHDPYPEKRFANAEIRARKLIRAVNKRRREMNEGKQFGDRKYYIDFWDFSGLVRWESTRSKYARGIAYPFGLFKDFADCETCMREFEDELEWFSEEYLALMAELDDYDWADAPGWGE